MQSRGREGTYTILANENPTLPAKLPRHPVLLRVLLERLCPVIVRESIQGNLGCESVICPKGSLAGLAVTECCPSIFHRVEGEGVLDGFAGAASFELGLGVRGGHCACLRVEADGVVSGDLGGGGGR